MKKRTPSLLFSIGNLKNNNIKKDLGSFVRRVNMDLNPKGFAGNKGLTDEYFCSTLEHVWVFDTKQNRDIALSRLRAFLQSEELIAIKTTTKMSSSRSGKRDSIRSPRLSSSLKTKWQHLIAHYATTRQFTGADRELMSNRFKSPG